MNKLHIIVTNNFFCTEVSWYIFFLKVSKILLHTSGRVLSGGITVVFGSITMAYDIYKLSTEMEAIATKKAGDELREIANQLEIALNSFLSGCNDSTSIQSTCDKINHNDDSVSQSCVKQDESKGENVLKPSTYNEDAPDKSDNCNTSLTQ